MTADDAPFADDANVNGVAGPGPTRLDPLRGLEYLAKVALVGRDRILERAKEPVAYVWQDIAVASTIVVIAGGPGEGKTTLLFLILVARMNEGDAVDVLGYRVEPAPHGKWIVLIEGEHGEGSTTRKLVKSCTLLDVNDIALQRVLIVARKAVRIGSPEWGDVTRLVAAGLVSDIGLDTIARVAPADGNSEAEQVAIFDLVAQTIDAAPADADKPTVWAAAHTRKNASGELADVSGSAQRTGQADTVLLVKGERAAGKVTSSTITFAKLREDPDDYPMPVVFQVGRDVNGKPCMHVGQDHQDDDAEAPLEKRVLDRLAGGPKTKSKLATLLSRSRTDIDAALSTLFSERRITTVPIKVAGHDRKAFAMRRDAPAATHRVTPDEAPDSPR